MVITWKEVSAKPEFKALTPVDQEATRNLYFHDVVAPQVAPDQLEATRKAFDADTAPVRPATEPNSVMAKTDGANSSAANNHGIQVDGSGRLSTVSDRAMDISVNRAYAPAGGAPHDSMAETSRFLQGDTNTSPRIADAENARAAATLSPERMLADANEASSRAVARDRAAAAKADAERAALRKETSVESPYGSAAISGVSRIASNIADIPQFANDAIKAAVVNPILHLAGQEGMKPTQRFEIAKDLQQAADEFTPETKNFEDLNFKDPKELGHWAAVNALQQAPQIALGSGAAFIPKVRNSYLALMGAMTAAGEHQKNLGNGVEFDTSLMDGATKGLFEVIGESLGFNVYDKFGGAIAKMTVGQRASFAKELASRTLVGATALAGQISAGAMEEGITQVGQNASSRYVLGDKSVNLGDGVVNSMAVGALMDAPMGVAHAANAAAKPITQGQELGQALQQSIDGTQFDQRAITEDTLRALSPAGKLPTPLTQVAAASSARQKTMATNQPHVVIEHPAEPGKFTAVPEAVAQQIAQQSAPASNQHPTEQDILSSGLGSPEDQAMLQQAEAFSAAPVDHFANGVTPEALDSYFADSRAKAAQKIAQPVAPVVAAPIVAQNNSGTPEVSAEQPLPTEAAIQEFSANPVDAAAHEAATSPLNNLPEPTQAQKEAGNYKKGHLTIHGLNVAIENPQGSMRSGTDPNGQEWSVTLPNHYGYIKRTEGADGDHVDTYIGSNPESDKVFVVDQVHADNGKFDEHKVMLGFDSMEEAVANYQKAFSDGNGLARVGSITPMTVGAFKSWLKEGDTKSPAAPQALGGKSIAPSKSANSPAPKKQKASSDLLQRIKQLGGINSSHALDVTGDPRGVAGWKFAFRKNGLGLDDLATQLSSEGFAINTSDVDGGVGQLRDMIRAHIGGERNFKYAAQEVAAEQQHRGANFDAMVSHAEALGINVKGMREQAILDAIYQEEDARTMATMGADELSDATIAKSDAAVEEDIDIAFGDEAVTDNAALQAWPGGNDEQATSGNSADHTGARAQEVSGSNSGSNRQEAGAGEEILQSYTNAEVLKREAAKAKAEEGASKEPPAKHVTSDQSDLFNTQDSLFNSNRKQPVVKESLTTQSETSSAQSGNVKQKPASIEDFGEKIIGARKEYAAAYKDKMSAAKEVDILAQPLSKSWPEPDYQKLIDAGNSPQIVGMVRSMRDEIPAKPGKSYRQRTWAAQVELLRDSADKLLNDAEYAGRFMDGLQKEKHLKLEDAIGGRAELYALLGHEKSLKGIRISRSEYGVYNGVPYSPDKIIWEVTRDAKATAFGNMPATLGHGDTRQSALDSFAKAYSALDTRKEKSAATKFELYADRYAKAGDKGQYFIGKKVGRNVLHIKDGFDTIKEAREYLANNNEELTAILEKKKEVPNERYDINQPRVGQDMRNAQDVTPQMFTDAFGFRGVQFGNYVEGARRQKDLNDAYDALMDLAAVLDIPPKALSLNGELGLAFGARGTGGKNPHSAHYEAGQVVINLTKGSGAGSLAHEWWHSLDNYFSRQRGKKDGYATDGLDVSLAAREADYHFKDDGIRKEMIDAFGAVVKAINQTAIKERSRSLDARRTKEYWGTGIEMSARAFERYVIAKLHDNSFSNDYLANVVSEEYWNAAEALGVGEGGSYPYPTESELPAIRDGFDKFFQTIESKETDKGVALFSRSNQHTKLYSQLARQIEAAPDRIFSTGKQTSLWLFSNQAKLGIKKDELHWSGVTDWLNTQGKITKSDVLAYLDGNGVQVEEVTLGGVLNGESLDRALESDDLLGFDTLAQARRAYNAAPQNYDLSLADTGGAPKFASYQLPGGENYRELLLTLPVNEKQINGLTVDGVAKALGYSGWHSSLTEAEKEHTLRVFDAQKNRPNIGNEQRPDTFKSGHYKQPNILAHIRFNERTDADGKRVLFIEEIQSDWGQKGKKDGFLGEQAKADDEVAAKYPVSKDRGQWSVRHLEDAGVPSEVADKWYEAHMQKGQVPDAPFVTDTKSWTALALKKMIAYAVDNGFDSVAWTTGEQQSARYDLSKQVSGISYRKNKNGTGYEVDVVGNNGKTVWNKSDATTSEIEDTVGKEIAQKIAAGATDQWKNISGIDLKVGGEGMKGYYDQIVPQVANDILKKLGGKVEDFDVNIMGPNKQGDDYTFASKQQGFTIPIEMRSKVQTEGLPMFAKSSESSNGMPVSAVESISNPIAEKMKNIRKVKVVARQHEIPGLKEQIDTAFSRFQQDRSPENLDKYLAVARDNIEGAYVNGELYLVASNLHNAERVQEVLRHEVAHLSVEQMLEEVQTGLYGKLLKNVRLMDATGNKYIRELAAAVDKSQPGLDKNSRAAEIIAQIAERGDHQDAPSAVRTVWRRLSDGIKAFYKLVFGDTLNDQDVRDIVAQSFRWARGEGDAVRVVGGESSDTQALNQSEDPLFSRSASRTQSLDLPVAEKSTSSEIPEETEFEKRQRQVQDKMNRFKVLQKWLDFKGVKLTDKANVHEIENLMHAKIANQTEDFRNHVEASLLERTAKSGFTLDQVADYLEAQHVPEANARMREIYQDSSATANGISDAGAEEALAEFQSMPKFAEFKKLADEFRAIGDETLDMRLREGLISKEQYDAYKSTFKHWVPLRGDGKKAGVGKGLSVNAKEKRRLGHGERENGEYIIENLLMDRERAIYQVEHNRVVKSIIQFALEAREPDMITVGKPEKRQVLKDQTVFEVQHKGKMMRAFSSESDAKSFINQAVALSSQNKGGGLSRSDFSIGKTSDPIVVMQASPMLAENEIQGYVAGHTIRIQINDELLARAATNMGVDQLNMLLSAARVINNGLSKVYTAYSPDFIFRNAIRDFIAGTVNLTGDMGAQMAGKIYLNYGKAAKELFIARNDPRKSAWVQKYRAAGGNTGAAYLSDIERVGSDAQAAMYERMKAMEVFRTHYAKLKDAGKSEVYARTSAAMRSGISKFGAIPVVGHFLTLIEHLNAVTENALRLATYMTLVQNGYTEQKAAVAAKNSTVNFNRKGEISNVVGSLYLFFNPSVQGSSRMFGTLLRSEHKHQAQALAGMLAFSAFVLAELGRGGDDDDERKWKNIPDHIKDHNLILKFGDLQWTIPVPYEFAPFHVLGNSISDAIHGESGWKASLKVVKALIDNTSPLGDPFTGEGKDGANLFQMTPTLVKMALASHENENSFGTPIQPEKSSYNENKPDSQNMFRNTKGTIYSGATEWLNDATGGTKYQSGGIDVSPETLKFWVSTLSGGAGRFVADSMSASYGATQGVSPDLREIPIARVFVREASVADARAKFWEAANEAKKAADALHMARKAHDTSAANEIRKEDGDLVLLAKFADRMGKAAAKKRDLIDSIRMDDQMPLAQKREKMKEAEKKEQEYYDRFLKRFDQKAKVRLDKAA